MNIFPDIAIIGDLNLDWCCGQQLPLMFSEIISNQLIYLPISELPGGSGVNFAKFAIESGFHPLVIGKVGQDYAGTVILETLKNWGAALAVGRHKNLGTGKAFIVWDNRHDSARLLVNNMPNANQSLNPSEIEAQTETIRNADFLYISGYCLMGNPRCEASQKAIEIAHNSNNTLSVLDVVPHKIYEHYSFENFLQIAAKIDILVSEVSTIRRFLRLGHKNEEVDEAKTKETIEHLQRYYQNFVLRFGIAACSNQVIVKNDKIFWEETGYAETEDVRGYGDRLLVKTLKEVFNKEK